MQAKLQKRIQRYGWDLAARDYESLWQKQLAAAQRNLMTSICLEPDESVLDAACGTGSIALDAARAVGSNGKVLGIDLSGQMVDAARKRGEKLHLRQASFARMDAEALDIPDASFDVALCALGLMYMPDPEKTVRELRRVLRPGGRLGLTVWGEQSRCGWSPLFAIVDAEVASEVCPLFFRLGRQDMLAQLCADAEFVSIEHRRVAATLNYANADEACNAAFVGGPAALAWSRFGIESRARVRARYLQAIEAWRHDASYSVPCEFVIVTAAVPFAKRI